MRRLLFIGLLLGTINSFGQVDSVNVDQTKLKSLLETVKKDKKKFDTFDKDFSEKDLKFSPVIEKSGLTRIEVKLRDKLIYEFLIDPKTYKIVAEDDLR
jgi:hypothetical protein